MKSRKRYFVPDLSPEQRPALADLRPVLVFVAESPHVLEVAPERQSDRRPLCGKAGREWWAMIASILGQRIPEAELVALPTLISLCRQARIVVLNAVQYPLDPAIMRVYGAGADPLRTLGFSKASPSSYKTRSAADRVAAAIADLSGRIAHPLLAKAPIVSLGLDAQWFVTRALGEKPGAGRHRLTLPHPSAWWRRGGIFRERARIELTQLLAFR